MVRTVALTRPRLLFFVTEDWYFCSHRLDLARAARDAGYEILVATRVGSNRKRIEKEGFKLFPLALNRGIGNPIQELTTIIHLVSLYRRERPDIVHHVAMKPVLYGSLAARMAQIQAVVNALGGLGSVFIGTGRKVRLLRPLMEFSLRLALALPNSRVIFQNSEDCEQWLRSKIVRRSQSAIIRGSGVDVSRFTEAPEPAGTPLVLLAGRMLWDKGVGDFVEAARLLRKASAPARCVLVGMVDNENPSCIPESQLQAWQKEGVVEWWGHQENMPEILPRAHVVVLPSYREGLPKVLLEASACARPIVATDVPGNREVVRDGGNGFLVPPKDPRALAQAITMLIKDPALRRAMGTRGRAIVTSEFASGHITRETLQIYRALLGYPRKDQPLHRAANPFP